MSRTLPHASPAQIVDKILALVGETPLLEIHYRLEEQPRRIYAKYEIMNMTGPEIERQLRAFGRSPDAFVAGVGTGGTVMGVGRCLRRTGRPVRIHPLEPANSPTMRTGCKIGAHRIQGISDEFIPSIIDLKTLDHIVDVWDGDAIIMAQATCSSLGLAVGISSGANVLGAMQLVEELGSEATVVTILPDSNKKYLSTDLCREEPA
jgi:cysteine synthase A